MENLRRKCKGLDSVKFDRSCFALGLGLSNFVIQMGACFDINFDWLLGGLHLYGHCLCENVVADEIR